MTNRSAKRKLAGPWRNLHAAVWLIGLAVLAWQGWWWPGILVLVGLSLVLEAAIMQFAPEAYVDEETPPAPAQPPAPAPAPAAAPAPIAPPEHRYELLP